MGPALSFCRGVAMWPKAQQRGSWPGKGNGQVVRSPKGSGARSLRSATFSNIRSTSLHVDFFSWKSWVQVLVLWLLRETQEKLTIAG